ncbi:MAG TPA: cell division protein FtsA [Dehalococcoidia bacterium]|nr:cell division protein FtsA [Dehalococcoidia bacterium]
MAIASIDVGSSKICTLVADVDINENKITKIHGVGMAPSRGIQKGIVTDLGSATEAIRESVKNAEGTVAPKIKQAYIGFSGKLISCTNPTVTVTTHRGHIVTKAHIREADIKVHKIPFPEDRVVVNITRRQYTLDGIGGIKNPLGMHGYRLDLESHIITTEVSFIENLLFCLRQAGVKLPIAVVNPLASSEAVLELEDKEAGVIVADIGGGTTDMAVFKDGSVWYSMVLPVGGKQITSDLAIGLSIPFDIAEKFKIEGGGLLREGDIWLEKEGYKISREDLSYIIRARIEEILRMVISAPPSEYKPTTLVLTGGTAKLPGIREFAQEVLGPQVQVRKPRGLPEGSEALNDPAYAAIVGLLLWGAKQDKVALARPTSILTNAFSTVGSTLGRVPPALGYVPSRLLSTMGFEFKRKG